MSLTRRVLASLTSAAALTFAAGVAQPAAAAVPSHRCAQGYVCFWTGDGFQGEVFFYQPVSDWCDVTPTQPARTIYNNTNRPWAFYRDTQCGALDATLAPGTWKTGLESYSWRS
ncbi:hypothetical protein HD597_006769 [Nonomuraea thailandensis]|uniref:Peptidase inhibitor family I36 n=1 Tax=Nonomuraea thailandensis TaxID=1188745 RepID=A0A9X2GLF1_9ACTN|nr:peptidase inhibitor family I36 protein [Nonomuraea thailandensis]MCP2359749.1 hypothetical protein [Nonomuraea thailandensis]